MSQRTIDLTPEQRSLIEKRLVEFFAGEAHEDCRKAAESAQALPLSLDWSACLAIRPDGEVIWIDYDEPHQVRAVEDERERNIGLFQGSRRYPELRFLVPLRPPDATDCPSCRGTGKLTFPAGYEHFDETIVCYCGGSGWLPAGTDLGDLCLTRRRTVRWSLLLLATVLPALYALSLLGLFPWSGLNCWQSDIDINSGRTRYTRYLFWISVTRSVRDSALTNALSSEDLAGQVPDWHPAVTLSPGLRHSPHYRFHSAIHQIRELEICWDFGKMTPAARRKTPRRVLRLWQQTGGYMRAEDYIQAVWGRALEAHEIGKIIDVADLPST